MAKKKTTPVKADSLAERLEGFSLRFNVDIGLGQDNLEQFQNRCISAVGEYVGDSLSDINRVTAVVYDFLGLSFSKENYCFSFEETALYESLTKRVLVAGNDLLLYKWLAVLECILNTDVYMGGNVLIFARKIATALKLSNVNAILCDTADGYQFYPASAELLDQKLVVDTLNWLNDYPKAKEQFNSALRLHLAGNQPRNAIDNLRLSVELFFKQVLGNDASLENQAGAIGGYLKNHCVSAEIRNMYIKLLDYFAKYNNNKVKHNDQTESISNAQIEYLIYLTGTFLRLIIQLERESTIPEV